MKFNNKRITIQSHRDGGYSVRVMGWSHAINAIQAQIDGAKENINWAIEGNKPEAVIDTFREALKDYQDAYQAIINHIK